MFKKFIFFLAWVGIFVLSVAGINFILLPNKLLFGPQIIGNLSLFELRLILLGIFIVYLFLSLYKFVSLFERKKEYEKSIDGGIIKISNTTINNYVTELLRKDGDVGNIKVNSERRGKNFFVDIKCNILNQVNIPEKIQDIKDRVSRDLQENIGIDVKEVRVKIGGLSTKEVLRDTIHNENVTEEEVI